MRPAPLLVTVGLIAAGVAALGVIVYEVYDHWGAIWSGMKDVVGIVYDWIKEHWPLLLGIITGPIVLAAAEIATHWDTIKGYAETVYRWLRDTWDDVEGFITAPINLAATTVSTMWDTLKSGAVLVYGWFRDSWKFIEGLITAPFRLAVDGIADIWNDTVGKLSFHIPGWVPGLGGKGFRRAEHSAPRAGRPNHRERHRLRARRRGD